MPRTPLFQQLVEMARTVASPTAGAADVSSMAKSNRRRFIGRIAAGTAGVAATTLSPWVARAAGRSPSGAAPKVAVIGAGLAGLTCAYRLAQAGIRSTVFEANSRLGGRCWTRRGDFLEGQIAEHGGELIDQGHTHIRQLVQELDLDLDNLLRTEDSGSVPCYNFGGSDYPVTAAIADLKGIWQKLHSDLSAANYPTLFNSSTPRGRALDQMSLRDWILETVPGGLDAPLGKLLDVAYNIEYGAETEEQSSLNLIYLLAYCGPGQIRIFGTSNEKYHVRGGNDQIVQRLATTLGTSIQTGTALVAVQTTSSGACALTFQSGRRVTTSVFDKVILALPFSLMRSMVDLTRSGFEPLKLAAIRELGYGTNSKLNLQFRSRPWRALGCTGETYSDRGYQATWEVSRGQTGTSGILVDYTGGKIGDGFGGGTPTARAATFLNQIEPVLPGLTSQWNGRATIDYWAGQPFARGSYSYWKVGQYSRFSGMEAAQQGNFHFAGEHTSTDAQGYLEGAVESGERAAAEVLDDLG